MDRNKEYTCIFGGGAIRGFAYIGAIKALEELDIKIKTVAGSSVGAIFAGLIAVGYTPKEIEEVLMNINFELFKDIPLLITKDMAISKGEIFLNWMRELIEKKFYGENYQKGKNPPVKFSDLNKKLVIITTDLTNFKCKEFSTHKTPDAEVAYAVRISASMPGLMKPVNYNDTVLVDGDLQKSKPLWTLAPELCKEKERILEFRLEGDFNHEKMRTLSFVNTVYSCVTSIATEYLVKMFGKKDKFDCLVINTGSIIIVDFNTSEAKRKNLIEQGYKQTLKYFEDTLKQKKQSLYEHYEKLYLFLLKFRRALKLKKFNVAKDEISMFYLKHFSTVSEYIDKDFVNELENIKNEFLSGYSISLLFRVPSLNNDRKILSDTELYLQEISQHIDDLKKYIEN